MFDLKITIFTRVKRQTIEYHQIEVISKMDVSFISERITELRLARNISEYQMSLELGKSKSYIQGTTSKKSLPSVPQLFEICDHLGVSLSEFFDPNYHDPPLLGDTVNQLRKLDTPDLQLIHDVICRFVSSASSPQQDRAKP